MTRSRLPQQRSAHWSNPSSSAYTVFSTGSWLGWAERPRVPGGRVPLLTFTRQARIAPDRVRRNGWYEGVVRVAANGLARAKDLGAPTEEDVWATRSGPLMYGGGARRRGAAIASKCPSPARLFLCVTHKARTDLRWNSHLPSGRHSSWACVAASSTLVGLSHSVERIVRG